MGQIPSEHRLSESHPLPIEPGLTESLTRTTAVQVFRWGAEQEPAESGCPTFIPTATTDLVAIEEPLEIRLQYGPTHQRISRSLSITMRTPGDDYELAVGFLLSEGIINRASDVLNFEDSILLAEPTANIVRVAVSPDVSVDIEKLQRHFYTTSSCGLCGKTSLEALERQGLSPVPCADWRLSPAWIAGLPAALRMGQRTFAATGGLHASGLFVANGPLVFLREDVGRHNALDKVLGRLLLEDRLPLQGHVLLVSGRTSLELMQKAVVAGIPVLAAIGAPSSLAINCAERFGVTLLGFVSENRFNCYANPQRIEPLGSNPSLISSLGVLPTDGGAT
ncbi:MAG: formate dehydrogenase accessory sulfurtransferase FdhD [Pirellulaceae bacterium]|nr:formate dehydrogenase accessory sulfurtransferase FdhD [Pirellulaceae bacterium]